MTFFIEPIIWLYTSTLFIIPARVAVVAAAVVVVAVREYRNIAIDAICSLFTVDRAALSFREKYPSLDKLRPWWDREPRTTIGAFVMGLFAFFFCILPPIFVLFWTELGIALLSALHQGEKFVPPPLSSVAWIIVLLEVLIGIVVYPAISVFAIFSWLRDLRQR